jgi:PAS domain S-box-containing protein
MTIMNINPEKKKSIPWKLAVIFILFSVSIILMGAYYYYSQKKRIFKEQENSLSAIASLKINQISNWHKERLGDATVISLDKPLIISIEQFFSGKNKKIKTELYDWMKSVRNEYDYDNVLLADTSLKVRLSVTPSDSVLGDSIKMEMKTSLRDHDIFMTDLHRSKEIPYIHIDILIPLFDTVKKKSLPVGLAVLRIDPDKVLFPLIQSWPTPSKSSETLIVRKDGDSVLYLNELRNRQNTSLKLKVPLSNEKLLASKAVRGFEGVVEGIDYRNIAVIGFITRIDGFPWYMVAKVDKEEIQAPIKRYLFISVLVVLLLILINAFVFGFWIWNLRVKTDRLQLKDEIALRESKEKLIESEELFRKLFENMLNGFAYCRMIFKEDRPHDFIYLKVNKAFGSLTGLINVEGRKVSDVIPGIQEADPELLERYGRVALTGKPEVFETWVVSMKMWFLISVYSPQKEYFVAVFDVITDRKLSEAVLRESEERFRSLYENVTIGIYRTTIDGRILMANPAMVSMLGFDSFEQLSQRNLQQEGYEPDYPRSKFLETIEKDGKIIGLESAWNQKNGETLFIRESANAVRDIQGKILYYDGTVEDITDRIKTEEALRESEERFSKSFKTSPISFMIANMDDGRILEINDAFTTISGYTREEALNNTTLNLKIWVHEEDRKHTIDSLREGNDILHLETLLRAKDGNVSTVLLSAHVIKLANRNCIISSIEDITKRKEAEDELRIQSEIMSHMAEAVYLVRMKDGIIVYTNSKFEELFGYGPGDMTGKHVSIVNAPTEKSPEQTAIEIMSQLDKNGFWTGEVLNIKKDGTFFWSHANVAIFNHSKYGKVLVSVQEDITDRKNAEFQIKKLNEELEVRVIQRTELLEAANKELEAFSYSVSHDLRAPLRSVHGFTKILLEDYEASLDEEGKRICGIISSSATQMGALIDDLLSFSRIGRSSLHPSEIDMKNMVTLIFEKMTSPTERKRIKMNIGKLPKAFGDVTLFGQVWTNLISNAIKYTSKNDVSEINIGSKVDGKMITYFIKDNGVGFDMQYAHKLFCVFQRLHSEAEFEGNGVGLAIIQRIILKHAGKVWAEGEVGKGATFYFSLPVQDINKKTRDTRLTTHG